jgi:cytochrome P450
MSPGPPEITYPSVAGAEDPFAQLAALREHEPVYPVPGTRDFLVTRWADVAAAARDHETFVSEHSRVSANRFTELGLPGPTRSMIEADPPAHRAKREPFFALVKPGRLREREPAIRAVIDELIDGFADRGQVELVAEFCRPLPGRVITRMLGFSDADFDWIQPWAMTDSAGTAYLSEDEQAAQREIARRAAQGISEALIARRDHRTDDGLSEVVTAHLEAHGTFDLDELRDNTGTFMRGGIITTGHMISMTMLLLLRHPQEMARVRADRARIPAMLEEGLRIQSPVQWVPRRVVRDTEIAGVAIPAGSRILLMWGSGNRDERCFAHADAFDPDREQLGRHMAFGLGGHFCLGAPIARLEGRIAFAALFDRLDAIGLAEGNDFTHIASPAFRGLNRLYLEFTSTTSRRRPG